MPNRLSAFHIPASDGIRRAGRAQSGAARGAGAADWGKGVSGKVAVDL